MAEIFIIPFTIEDAVAFDLCAVVGAPYWLFLLRVAWPKFRTCKTYHPVVAISIRL